MPAKAEVYRLLARRYGWGHDKIARMTPYQQLIYLLPDGASSTDKLYFRTEKEYEEWLTTRG